MDHIRWLTDPSQLSAERGINSPVLVVAFTGWNDAGDAASTALRTLIDASAAQPLAEIDPEAFTDFATVRPLVRLDAEHRRSIVWPAVGVWSASLPGTDVVLLIGPEPALRWRLFSEQVTSIVQQVGATMVITLGALLADVPHTRSTPLIATAGDDLLEERFDLERPTYEGPTGIVGVIAHSLGIAGIPAASLWAAVPGYAAQIPSPRAAIALVERACSMMGAPAPVATLRAAVPAYDARIEALVADDDDLSTYVARLEAMADELGDDDTGDVADVTDEDSADLVDEVERFLRERDS